jgi:hypothetical protein
MHSSRAGIADALLDFRRGRKTGVQVPGHGVRASNCTTKASDVGAAGGLAEQPQPPVQSAARMNAQDSPEGCSGGRIQLRGGARLAVGAVVFAPEVDGPEMVQAGSRGAAPTTGRRFLSLRWTMAVVEVGVPQDMRAAVEGEAGLLLGLALISCQQRVQKTGPVCGEGGSRTHLDRCGPRQC